MIAIVDYGAGNLMSVKKALDFIGEKSVITSDCKAIETAERVILPGVGSFGDAMDSMRQKGLDETVKHAALSGKPFLGICLGLQLLFESSAESPEADGLEFFPAIFRLFQEVTGSKCRMWAGIRLKPSPKAGFSAIFRAEAIFISFILIILTAQSPVLLRGKRITVLILSAPLKEKIFLPPSFTPKKAAKSA